MSDDVKFSLIWGTVLVSVVSVIAFSLCSYHSNVANSAIEAGLVQDSVPGEQGVYWVREAK